MTALSVGQQRLIALDIDGTLVDEDSAATQAVQDAVRAAQRAGHVVMLSTGRPTVHTLPISALFGLEAEYMICSNGAVVLRRDPMAVGGYSPVRVETFDPRELILAVHGKLPGGNAYAVEDDEGMMRYTDGFPEQAARGYQVDFEELLEIPATRLVVVAADATTNDFFEFVESRGLHRSTYTVGHWAWLDIAPEGTNKATALAWVTERLGMSVSQVITMGDGQNDIEMLEWAASGGGVGVAMGQADEQVKAAASEVTGSVQQDGVAAALKRLLA